MKNLNIQNTIIEMYKGSLLTITDKKNNIYYTWMEKNELNGVYDKFCISSDNDYGLNINTSNYILFLNELKNIVGHVDEVFAS